MTCTTNDCFAYELQGIPTVAVASDAFIPQAKYQVEKLGMEDLVVLFIRHPVSNCTVAEIKEKADEIYAKMIRALQFNSIERDTRWIQSSGSAECTT